MMLLNNEVSEVIVSVDSSFHNYKTSTYPQINNSPVVVIIENV